MFELGQGDNLPFSSVLTLAWVQLPCEAWLGGTESTTTFRAVRWGAGLPSLRKGMQIVFKRDERELTKCGQVWPLCAQPFPGPKLQAPFIVSHSHP